MDVSNLAPNWQNVLNADTLKLVGVIMAFLAGKWAIGKAWSATKFVAKTTAASMSVVGVLSAVLLMAGAGGIGAGVGEGLRWKSAQETTQVAAVDKLPDNTVTRGTTAMGLGIGAVIVGIAAFIKKYG